VSAYNSYGESAQSGYGYATTPTSLMEGVWDYTDLSPGEVHYYSFYANSKDSYMVYWEDRDYENSYGDIRVSATDSSGTVLFNREDSGFNGRRVSTSSSGYIMLKVEGYDSSSSGFYFIEFEQE
jgi:hypothetical protein